MIVIKFFRSLNNNEPVRVWLKSLDSADRKRIGDDLQTVQLGWKKGVIREPLVKTLDKGMWELRTSLPSHRIARVIFCQWKECIVLLHGFIKKTQKISILDLTLARARKKRLQQDG